MEVKEPLEVMRHQLPAVTREIEASWPERRTEVPWQS